MHAYSFVTCISKVIVEACYTRWQFETRITLTTSQQPARQMPMMFGKRQVHLGNNHLLGHMDDIRALGAMQASRFSLISAA